MPFQDSKLADQDAKSVSLPFVVPPTQPLGKPTVKKRFHLIDLFAVTLSFLCLAIGLASVADESLSWQLGKGTYQLIVLGFLLSIMNLCLASVTPTLFLLLEARFGTSKLQNYEDILRNEFLASRLSFYWRGILIAMMALPIGLSVAYKSFTGGHSARIVSTTDYVFKDTSFGLSGPPGVLPIGFGLGVNLFFNITLPFAIATSWAPPDTEPVLPKKPQAYGFNVLFVNNETTAVLDAPNPHFVSEVQALLADGESWNVTAPVTGTVSTFNRSKAENPKSWNDTFMETCSDAQQSSGAFTHQSLLNNWAIDLIDHPSPGDQSWQYLGISPDPGINRQPFCQDLAPHSMRFDIVRKHCQGTWSITRGDVMLVDGSCTDKVLPPEQQIAITDNRMFLGLWYMPGLVEFLGPFSEARNGSDWTVSTFATVTAAMIWSRITAMNSPYLIDTDGFERPWKKGDDRIMPSKEAGLQYQPDMELIYIRPTLRKSASLYIVLAVQPLLTVVALCLTWCLYSTPLDRGFGLVSILSGLDKGSLDALHGAGLSGELMGDTKLSIQTDKDEGRAYVRYSVLPSSLPIPRGRVEKKTVYH
ncbi:hypothetical protein FDECE_2817 [Fusarium decemcellulare]|nr:hypothetical protein FDECE_2817 [Fusarium decemcellulare]